MDTSTMSAEPDVLDGALLVLAAVAGLVLALTHHPASREAARNDPVSKSPATSKCSSPVASQADYF